MNLYGIAGYLGLKEGRIPFGGYLQVEQNAFTGEVTSPAGKAQMSGILKKEGGEEFLEFTMNFNDLDTLLDHRAPLIFKMRRCDQRWCGEFDSLQGDGKISGEAECKLTLAAEHTDNFVTRLPRK